MIARNATSIKRFVLSKLNRDSPTQIWLHLIAQWISFSIRSRFSYTTVMKCGWKRKSDRIFIIAAGPSVNEISDRNWKEISRDDTLAMSYGSLVPVAVDAFFSEFSLPSSSRNQKLLFCELSRRHAINGYAPLCIWKHPEHQTNTDFLSLKITKVLTLVIPAQSVDALNRIVHTLTRLKVHNRFCLQSAGSISAAIMFARAFNYKEAVLIGVDLSDRRYFFDENPNYDQIGLQNPFLLDGDHDLSKPHQVTTGYNDLENVANRIKISAGDEMKIFVSSKNSGLSSFFPIFNFHENKEN